MTRSVLALVICLCLACAGWSQQDRLWTDSTGKQKVIASYVDQDKQTVRLKKQGGLVVSVPVARLSQADQAYLRELAESAATMDQRDASQKVEHQNEQPTELSVTEAPADPSVADDIDVADKTPQTGESREVDKREPGIVMESTDARNIPAAVEPAESNAVGKMPPSPVVQPQGRSTLPPALVKYGLVVWIVLAFITTILAWVRFHRAVLWFPLGLVLPGIALILLLRKERPIAGECQTHQVLHGETRTITKQDALAFTAKQFPRIFARSTDVGVAFTFLKQARERLANDDDWTMCHRCADAVGASLKERLSAKFTYRWDQLLRLYPFLYVLEDALIGPRPPWEVMNDAASTQLLHEVQLGGTRGLAAVDATLTPNTYQLPGPRDRKSLQTALLTAEERYIQRASAAMTVERISTETEVRKEEAMTRKKSKGTSGLGKAGTAVLVGALTGNVAFGVAAGGSLHGKDPKQVRLEQQRQRKIRQGRRQVRRINKVATRLSRRGDDLRGLLSGEGTLLPIVCKWGVFLPSLMAFAFGFGICFVLLFMMLQWVFYPGSMLLGCVFFTILSTFISAVLVTTLFTTRLMEIRSVIDAYPDVAAEIRTTSDNERAAAT